MRRSEKKRNTARNRKIQEKMARDSKRQENTGRVIEKQQKEMN